MYVLRANSSQQITDLRSEVVKTCAQTISTFAQELELNFLKCVRRLLGPLTNSLRFPNKVIQGSKRRAAE